MLTRLISPRILTTTSLRFVALTAPKLGDGDHTKSKAEEKAAEDLKTRKEKRWLDTTASDSGIESLLCRQRQIDVLFSRSNCQR